MIGCSTGIGVGILVGENGTTSNIQPTVRVWEKMLNNSPVYGKTTGNPSIGYRGQPQEENWGGITSVEINN